MTKDKQIIFAFYFIIGFCYVAAPVQARHFLIADHDVTALIAAIQLSNTDNQPDTIYLAMRGQYVLTAPIPSIIDGNSGLPDVILDGTVTNKIVVFGNGATLERDPAAPAFRIWMIFAGSLQLNDVVIKNGKLNGNPGLNGGGIANYGELTVNNSTFENNTASFLGGALYISVSCPTTLLSCTLTGNTANTGGAIYFYSSSAVITNCTIAKNISTGSNATAMTNALTVDDPARRVFIKNSIIASNTNNGIEADVTGTLISLGHNLVGENSDTNTQVYMAVGSPNNVGDYIGTRALPIDPLLYPLAMNGGLTPTMSLQSGSPAFNTGGFASGAPAWDQAGNNRIGNPEIGSLELNNNPVLNPVIQIKQGNAILAPDDGYDFGSMSMGGPALTSKFTILNMGFALKLNILSTPGLQLTGIYSDDFVIDQTQLTASLPGNSETYFYVTFSPKQPGNKMAKVSLASNDTGNPIFSFTIKGSAVSSVDVSLPVTVVSPVCEGTSSTVSIQNSEEGVNYQAFLRHVPIGALTAGSGSIQITLPDTELEPGNNTISILADNPGTGRDTLDIRPDVLMKSKPSVSLQPSDVTGFQSMSAGFMVMATGDGITYRWRKGTDLLSDGASIAGATSSQLTLTHLTNADAGGYNCVMTNACGSVTSSVGTLTIAKITPAITFTSSVTQGTEGDILVISATSNSSAPIHFSISGGTGQGTFVSADQLKLEKAGTLTLTAIQEATPDFMETTAQQVITINADLITGVGELPAKPEFQFFPNPAHNKIAVIGITAGQLLTLFSATGLMMKSWTVNASAMEFDLDGIGSGVFFIEITSQVGDVVRRRLVIP